YYYAALLWENVPLILEPSTPDMLPEGNTLAEVWVQIEKDLTEAAAVLPPSWDDANVGRPTKGAAQAFLGRVFMQQRKWQEAKDALDYLVTGAGAGNYDLVADYR